MSCTFKNMEFYLVCLKHNSYSLWYSLIHARHEANKYFKVILKSTDQDNSETPLLLYSKSFLALMRSCQSQKLLSWKHRPQSSILIIIQLLNFSSLLILVENHYRPKVGVFWRDLVQQILKHPLINSEHAFKYILSSSKVEFP